MAVSGAGFAGICIFILLLGLLQIVLPRELAATHGKFFGQMAGLAAGVLTLLFYWYSARRGSKGPKDGDNPSERQ